MRESSRVKKAWLWRISSIGHALGLLDNFLGSASGICITNLPESVSREPVPLPWRPASCSDQSNRKRHKYGEKRKEEEQHRGVEAVGQWRHYTVVSYLRCRESTSLFMQVGSNSKDQGELYAN